MGLKITRENRRQEVTVSAKPVGVGGVSQCAKNRLHDRGYAVTSAQALEPMIGLLSVVAVTQLNLREAARRPDSKERPATEVVDPHYVRLLSTRRHAKPMPQWSAHDFFMVLARLSRHQNRKRDRRPGWKALQQMLDGAQTAG